MVEDHEGSEAGQLPKAWTRGCRKTESCQRASGAKSPYVDSAEWDEKCPGLDNHRHYMKDSRFCQS